MAKKPPTTDETQVERDQTKAKMVELSKNYREIITLIVSLLGDLSKSKVQLQQLEKYYSIFKGPEPAKDVSSILAPAFSEIAYSAKKTSESLKEFRTEYNDIQKDLNILEGKGILNRIRRRFEKDDYFTAKYDSYKIKPVGRISCKIFPIQSEAEKVFSADKQIYIHYKGDPAMNLMGRAKPILYNKFLKASSELGDLYKDKTEKTERLKLKATNSIAQKQKKDIEWDIRNINKDINEKEKEIKRLGQRYNEVKHDLKTYISKSLWSQTEEYYIKKYSLAKWQKLPRIEPAVPLDKLIRNPVAPPKIDMNIMDIISDQDLNISVNAAQALRGQTSTNDTEVSKQVRAVSPTPLPLKPRHPYPTTEL